MTHTEAQAIADRMNVKDAGVLRYSVLTIGRDAIVMVYNTVTGAELGDL